VRLPVLALLLALVLGHAAHASHAFDATLEHGASVVVRAHAHGAGAHAVAAGADQSSGEMRCELPPALGPRPAAPLRPSAAVAPLGAPGPAPTVGGLPAAASIACRDGPGLPRALLRVLLL
jgi:hypothetical protein